jgi:hypothetical protein
MECGEGMGSQQGRLTAGTVEEAVSGIDGVVDDIRGNGVVDLPEAEAHLGHIMAAAELDDLCLMADMFRDLEMQLNWVIPKSPTHFHE